MGYKQSRMLQIISIILIIFALFRGIVAHAMLTVDIYEITPDGIIMIQGFHAIEGVPLLGLVSWTTFITEFLLFLFGAVTDLIAGIVGIASWKKPERVNRCFLWGLIAIAVNIMVMFVLEPAAGIGSLVIQILYMMGIYRMKNLE